MRILIWLTLLTLAVQARPTVGLVLSGGGARGGAHLGVIKMLEKHQIPIDYIAGTSMGALVGGLYASGKGSDEIERLLLETEWGRYITTTFERRDLPYRRKQFDYDFPGRLMVGVNSENEFNLQAGIFSRQNMMQLLEAETFHVRQVNDFNTLPIPFRAVASDITNGQKVELASGALSEAIYASLAIPGGFEPITIGGHTLVDGGITANLPVETMRRMGADIIIAVDISTPYAKNIDVNSYLTVLGQLSDILTRNNVEASIASMKMPLEILITPQLGDIGNMDADRYSDAIRIGAESIETLYDPLLFALSLDSLEYQQYLIRHRTSYRHAPPVIDRIRINNQTHVSDKMIASYLHVKTGSMLDLKRLQHDLMRLYHLALFENVDYALIEDGNETLLEITLTPSWNSNGILRFGMAFEDNFEGQSDYALRFEYTMLGLNSYGGEWRSRFAVGQEKLIFSEWYQPLDVMRISYIRPHLYYRDRKIYVTPNALGVSEDTTHVLPLKDLHYGVGVGIGANIGRLMQIEGGIRAQRNEISGNLLTLLVTPEIFEVDVYTLKEKKISRALYAKAGYDSFDNAFFPTEGYNVNINWIHELEQFEGELDDAHLNVKASAAYSYGNHTLIPKVEYSALLQGRTNASAFESLGGFGRLSGYTANAFAGDMLALGVLDYHYNVTKNAFLGTFSAPLYVGGMFESGNVWNKGDAMGVADMIHAGNVYVASDTVLGP